MLGAGVVNKKVLEGCGIDTNEYSGFACYFADAFGNGALGGQLAYQGGDFALVLAGGCLCDLLVQRGKIGRASCRERV